MPSHDVMPNMELYQPVQVEDALEIANRYADRGWLVGGGQDTYGWLKDRAKSADALIDLVKEFTGNDISKNLQSSDFGGDLTEKQLQYCAKDVIYLHEISQGLEKILIREKRHQLYLDSIKFINNRVNLDLASFSQDIWSH